MIDRYAEMKFSYTYNYAGYIREKVFENDEPEMLEPELNKLLKPQKETILHDYIQSVIEEDVDYSSRKMSPIKEREELLRDYKVPFSKVDDDDDDDYLEYLDEKVTTIVVPKIANETFHLLFSDRMFCLKFNELVAEIISGYKKVNFPNLLERDGVVLRCDYFPVWVQNAVFFRDRGCCAICLTDLTNLIKTMPDRAAAIDHIVPLNLGGSNDITNLQTICEKCNLNKLGHTIRTSEYYPIYF